MASTTDVQLMIYCVVLRNLKKYDAANYSIVAEKETILENLHAILTYNISCAYEKYTQVVQYQEAHLVYNSQTIQLPYSTFHTPEKYIPPKASTTDVMPICMLRIHSGVLLSFRIFSK